MQSAILNTLLGQNVSHEQNGSRIYLVMHSVPEYNKRPQWAKTCSSSSWWCAWWWSWSKWGLINCSGRAENMLNFELFHDNKAFRQLTKREMAHSVITNACWKKKYNSEPVTSHCKLLFYKNQNDVLISSIYSFWTFIIMTDFIM